MFVIQDGRICFANPKIVEIGEYTKEELAAKPFLEFVHPDDRAMVGEQHMRRLAGEKLKDTYAFRILPKEGSVRWMEINASLITWEGRPAVLVFLSDITGRQQAEEALSQANKKLNLLSSITRHDILNQLVVLRGHLALSKRFLHDPDKLREFIKKEIKAAQTIEDQISFTRTYQNMGVHAPAWQNVNASISRAVATLPMRGVKVEVDRTDLEVFADPLLEKVFYNLIDNALRYGGDAITIVRISSHESGRGMIIVCEDDGMGISGEAKSYLFKRGHGKNTGLGLFLVREILGITGITICETSEPGKGARFEIMVPGGIYRFTKMQQ
jgi:PAS domain S-box-containing protein